ncbi:hypothetical protein PHK61_23810 [Actinomycetospora lutea]|uniref:hypothetical protein n=1 Tax=Actinomycetospora lutea TaxID=663604 RepID=UPI002366019D|nr:hypothetical protein [Actinomycetospora lutea]MDD7941453.1 hypothetical protein [Actinomycetospora lutea]
MYNFGVAPLAMGVGAGASLPFLEMSPFWVVLATFALVACGSAIRRVLPRIVVADPAVPAPAERDRRVGKHARR